MDLANKHFVGLQGQNIVILNPPSRLSKDDALLFAAWIVALADYEHDGIDAFNEVLEAVQGI
jgi:hypothetical protein